MPEPSFPNLADTMSSAFDAASGGDEAPDSSQSPPAGDEADASLPVESSSEPSEPVEVADDSLKSEISAPADEISEGEELQSPIAAPNSWADSAKEQFSQLPPDIQRVIADRESERDSAIQEKSQQLAHYQRAYDDIGRTLEPYMESFQQQGLSPAAGLGQLMQLWSFANDRPSEFVQWFAQQRGVRLDEMPDPQGESPDFADPRVDALQQEIAQLRQSQQQAIDAERQAVEAENRQTILEFMNAKDDNGQALHPHFEKVRMEVASLLRANADKPGYGLKEAYEQAVWANPETRSLRQNQVNEKALAEKRAAAEKAKRAAAQPRSAGGQFKPVRTEPRSISDTMSEAYERAVRS